VPPAGRTVEVVGESHYQESPDAICGGKCEDGHHLMCQAELRPEPENPYDRHAVAVYVDDRKVGHLSRDDDGDEGHYGIRLDLDWP